MTGEKVRDSHKRDWSRERMVRHCVSDQLIDRQSHRAEKRGRYRRRRTRRWLKSIQALLVLTAISAVVFLIGPVVINWASTVQVDWKRDIEQYRQATMWEDVPNWKRPVEYQIYDDPEADEKKIRRWRESVAEWLP